MGPEQFSGSVLTGAADQYALGCVAYEMLAGRTPYDGPSLGEVMRVVGVEPAYVSFDVDGLDPVFAPGTGTPEVGGLTTREAQHLLRGLRGMHLVGGDVVEVSPPYDDAAKTAIVGAIVAMDILHILGEARDARR